MTTEGDGSSYLGLIEERTGLELLRDKLSELSQLGSAAELRVQPGAQEVFSVFLGLLNDGTIRAAEPITNGEGKIDWQVNPWVREAIVRVGFRLGVVKTVSAEGETLYFSDKDTLPTRPMNDASQRTIRLVPGGSSIRSGSYIGERVIMMPPSFVNIGAFVDDGTMIDSVTLVGSCAQVGKNVHISAGAKIGGVLEPANARPCIVEDDVRMLADSGIYEGVMLRRGAVLAPKAILTSGIEVWERMPDGSYVQLENTRENPIIIPERALVTPRSRHEVKADGTLDPFGKHIAMISGYYPPGGNPDLAINEALRS